MDAIDLVMDCLLVLLLWLYEGQSNEFKSHEAKAITSTEITPSEATRVGVFYSGMLINQIRCKHCLSQAGILKQLQAPNKSAPTPPTLPPRSFFMVYRVKQASRGRPALDA